MTNNYLDISGVFLITIYLLVFIFIFNVYSNVKYSKTHQIKKFFLFGLYFKLFGALFFAFIYDQYYLRGGDSFSYFYNSCNLGDVLFTDFDSFLRIFIGAVNENNVYALPTNLQYFPDFRDPSIVSVHRFMSLFTILGLKHYYLTIIVLNVFNYIIIWKVFLFFNKLFMEKSKILAIGLLFIPSVAFWGSGIVKDSFTFTFGLVFISAFYSILSRQKNIIFHLLKLLLSAYIVLSLKPYILYAFIVAGFVWFGFRIVNLVKNRILRVFVLPIILLGIGIGGMFVLSSVANIAGGSYKDVDSMLGKAVDSQQDLKQEYYQGSSFDIGDYDATVSGAASVTPAAIVAGLYRPFIFEANSIVMLLSGLENTVLLLLSLYVLFRAGPGFFFKQLTKEPFIIFCFVFSLIMAMGIGLSTSNFGALVRFKIPLIPFFLMGWLFVLDEYKKSKAKPKVTNQSEKTLLVNTE